MRLTAFALAALLVSTALAGFALKHAIAAPSGQPGIIETYAGGGSDTGNDIPALDAQVVPVGLAIAPNGDLYMSEFGGCRIRKVNGGIVSAVVGGASCGYSGDGGPAVDAEISRPSSMAFDAAGNLYIADSWNCAVRRVDVGTGIINTVAGHPPCDTYSYTDPLGVAATDAHLSRLSGIAVDSSAIYVAETDTCRIDKISGGVIERYAGASPPSSPWTCASDGDGPALSQHIDEVSALALDAGGNLLFDGGSHCDIRKVFGGTISTIAAGVCGPYGGSWISSLASGSSDSVFLADPSHCHVRVWRGTSIYDVAGLGTIISPCGYSGDGGPAIDAKMDQPTGVVLDDAGNLYVADLFNNRVRIVYGANLDSDDDGMDDASEGARDCLQPYVPDGTDDDDGDTLNNVTEVLHGTDPCSSDTDSDGLTDGFELAHTCLEPQVYDGESDNDFDGLYNQQEQAAGTDPCAADTDADGCSDGKEAGTSHAAGGQRDPLDPYDFFDVPVPFSATPTTTGMNHAINAADVLTVRTASGTLAGHAGYNDQYDRVPNPNAGTPWLPGPPNGAVNAADVLTARASSGDLCV